MENTKGACGICEYKGIMILERETTAELLLTKLAHQPLLFFFVWKTTLSREIQSIECSEKLDTTVDFSVLVEFITLT